jgi:tRNA C32,U32 (ribose-2'-O)-methylase TrmJ
LLSIPTDPDFSSLNLAMAVQILTYELRLAGLQAPEPQPEPDSPPATAGELEYFYEHLEQVLHASGFLDPDNPRLLMRRLRRLFVKAEPDKNEINILRGILTALNPANPDGKGE